MNGKIRSVVISGATSSIGVALVEQCISEHIKVLALVNPKSQNIKRIQSCLDVDIQECSLDDLATANIGGEYDAFFHLAWKSTGGDLARNLILPQVDNVKYTLDAAKLAQKLGCRVFVGAGSQAEYGRTNEILTEDTACYPETAYGIAKLCAGQMSRLYCKQNGIKHVWPRILSSYGPNSQKQTVINYTINELLNDRSPSLSAGDQIWDFIYISDLARAMILLAQNGHDGEIYVIGSGKSRPLRSYLEEIRDIINPSLELGFGERSYTENTVMHLSCDITKLKTHTGFSVETDFETGIKKTIQWMSGKQQ